VDGSSVKGFGSDYSDMLLVADIAIFKS